MRQNWIRGIAILGLSQAASICQAADYVYTDASVYTPSGGGSSENVKSYADFNINTTTHTLTVVLKNTSTVPTPDQAGILTGVMFDNSSIAQNSGLNFSAAHLSAGSTEYVTATSHNQDMTADYRATASGNPNGYGRWDLAHSSGGYSLNGINYHYGLGTTGINVWNGNSTGGKSDYGLIAANTVLSSNSPGPHFPYIESSLTFTIQNFYGDVSKVGFVYGTAPDAVVGGILQTPEPGDVAMLASLGLSGAGLLMRRRRK